MRSTQSSTWFLLLSATLGIIENSVPSPSLAAPSAPSGWTEPAMSYDLSVQVPYQGDLDRYHNVFSNHDPIANTLYTLRNTAVEDLLQTRRSLKILLGGTAAARIAANDPQLSFSAPEGVLDLYLLGRFKEKPRLSPIGEGGNSFYGKSKSVPTHGSSEIESLIRWLGYQEPKTEPSMKSRLALGLAYISSQITKIDRNIRYLKEDFWKISTVDREFYDTYVRPKEIAAARSGRDIDLERVYLASKQKWMKQHGALEDILVLESQRELLLNRYHLLAIRSANGTPLYQEIYQALEKIGFPSQAEFNRSQQIHLPTEKSSILLPVDFEQQLSQHWDNWSAHDLDIPAIQNALLIALKANTERLKALSQSIDYDGSRNSILLDLAEMDDLWTAAEQKYSYLSGLIQFKTAKKEIQEYLKSKASTEQKVRFLTYGLSVGVGVAAIAGTSGILAASQVLTLPIKTWLIGSGILATGQATYDWTESSRKAALAQGIYEGSGKSGCYEAQEAALTLKNDDFKMLLANLVVLGAETQVLQILSKGKALFTSGGQTVIRISKNELPLLKESVQRLSARAEKLAPLGKPILAVVRSLLQMTSGMDVPIELEKAIAMVARDLKLTPKAIQAKLEQSATFGSLARGWRVRQLSARILVKPSFLKTLMEQQANGFTVGVVTEYAARGDRMLNEEFADFANDTVQGALITTALVWIGAPIAREAEEIVNGSSKLTVRSPFWSTKAGKFIDQGGQNFLVGLSVNGTTTAISEGIQWMHEKESGSESKSPWERAQATGKNALWGGLFMGISSNARYQFFSWLDDHLSKTLQSQPTAKILIQSAWTGNNLFGGWSYVTLGKLTGFLNNEEGNAQGHTQLQLESAGDAFLKINVDPAGADYLFDFLRDGEAPQGLPGLSQSVLSPRM